MGDLLDKVREFSESLVRSVDEALQVRLDYTPDTLPFLDHYLEHCRVNSLRPEFLQLLAPMVACYFGEVVTRTYEARWVAPENEIATWRVEFCRCFLFFNPMGVAVETFLEKESDGVPGAFQVSLEQRKGIQEILESQPSVLEKDFYTLTVRWEILDLIHAHLIESHLLSGRKPEMIDERQYREQIAAEESQ